jgi:hypothetical protein
VWPATARPSLAHFPAFPVPPAPTGSEPMPYVQIACQLDVGSCQLAEDVLIEQGAMSVTFQDPGGAPVLEPDPWHEPAVGSRHGSRPVRARDQRRWGSAPAAKGTRRGRHCRVASAGIAGQGLGTGVDGRFSSHALWRAALGLSEQRSGAGTRCGCVEARPRAGLWYGDAPHHRVVLAVAGCVPAAGKRT